MCGGLVFSQFQEQEGRQAFRKLTQDMGELHYEMGWPLFIASDATASK